MVDRSITTDSTDLARLRRGFDGQILLPDQPGYHQARQVWNAMVDRRPALIARFQLVSADGELLHASESKNPDLYWGLRGGGGNFGVVTQFEFDLHPVGTAALQRWRGLLGQAPRQAILTAWAGTAGAPPFLPPELHGRPMASVGSVWVGDPDQGRALLPYAGLQSYGGAVADVGDDETAFSHRDALVEFIAVANWTDPAEDQPRMSAARRYAGAVEPFASGVYVNDLGDEGEAGIQRAYGAGKLARLAELKERC